MQHDMQMVWWDETVPRLASEIFAEYPECVNIQTQALPRHVDLSHGLEHVKPKLVQLQHYGLTDTGLYDLAKWRARTCGSARASRSTRQSTAGKDCGYSAIRCRRWRLVPWPAVVRAGGVGREVQPREKFLLRPLTDAEIDQVKESTEPVWLESVCRPVGLDLPDSLTGHGSAHDHYWVYRYRDIRAAGSVRRGPGGNAAACPPAPRCAVSAAEIRAPRARRWPAWHAARRAIGRSRP